MDFTPRDARLLRWINGHGFVTVQHAATWLDIRYQTCHRRLKRLVDGGYLTTMRVGHSRYTYRLTKAGIRASSDDLPPLKFVAMGSCEHDMQLVDLAMMLAKQTGGHFVTERRIRQDRGLAGIGTRGHVSDGLLQFDDKKPVAIELELSTKGWRRLQRIMTEYAANLDIDEVWYFAGSAPMCQRLKRAADGYAFIKVHSWMDQRFKKKVPCLEEGDGLLHHTCR